MSNDVFTDALNRIKSIGESAQVSSEVINGLMHPRAILTAALPVRMDDGSTKYFTGFRCQ